jgi:hypothetical protein
MIAAARRDVQSNCAVRRETAINALPGAACGRGPSWAAGGGATPWLACGGAPSWGGLR